MLRKPPDRLYAHRIAEPQSRLALVDFNREGAGPLQTCVLSTGKRSDPRRSVAAVDEELNATAALRGSEATCQTIGPEFAHSPAVAPATEHRRYAVTLAGQQFLYATAILRCHLVDQGGRTVFGPPPDVIRRDILEDRNECALALGGWCGQRQVDEGQVGVSRLEPAHRSGAQPRWPRVGPAPRTSLLALSRHHEQSRAALRPEPTCVDEQHVDDVVDIRQPTANVGQVCAAPRRKKACHVLQQDDGRRSAPYAKGGDDVQERPDRPRMLAGQTRAVPGKGEINAREGGGNKIQTGRQVAYAEIVDVAKEKVLVAESPPVHLFLERRDVVGEDASPTKWLYRFADQTDSGKELRESTGGRRRSLAVRLAKLGSGARNPERSYTGSFIRPFS